MKERILLTDNAPNSLSSQARDLILKEQQKALEANLQGKDVSELTEHLKNYDAFRNFALALGLIRVVK